MLCHSLISYLAQASTSSAPKGSVRELAIVGLIFIGLLLILGLGIQWARKLIQNRKNDNLPVSGFGISDMRQMLKQGLITQEEFDAARQKIIKKTEETLKEKEVPKAKPSLDEQLLAARRAREQATTQPEQHSNNTSDDGENNSN